MLLYIVDYYSNFPTVKKVGSLSADDLVQTAKKTFAEYDCLKGIISDVDMNFTLETFRSFWRHVNIKQSMTSFYQHHSYGQVILCIKFVTCTIKKCIGSNQDVNLALFQKWSTSVGTGLTSPAMLLFNKPIRGLLLQIHKEPININNNDPHFKPSKHIRINMLRTMILIQIHLFFHRIYSSSAAWRWRTMNTLGHRRGKCSGHRVQSYIIWVTKTGRPITYKIRCAAPQ